MHVDGYLKDESGNPLGVTGNPLVVTFSTTAPSTFHFSEPTVVEVEKIVYLENLSRVRKPKNFVEKLWQDIGKWRGWI